MPITTKVVSSNPFHGNAYSIQQYVIKFVSLTGRWFSPGTPVSFTNKTDCHDITEIFLKVASNAINQSNQSWTGIEPKKKIRLLINI